jgi:ABC-type cobalamin/Fe3+-siderophores transport system ATPase subunit
MSSVRISSQITVKDLLQGVAQLSSEELDYFIERAIEIRSSKEGISEEAQIKTLIEAVGKGPEQSWLQRLEELDQKRINNALSDQELKEFQQMGEELEEWSTQRLKHLVQLAALKKTDLPALVKELELDNG